MTGHGSERAIVPRGTAVEEQPVNRRQLVRLLLGEPSARRRATTEAGTCIGGDRAADGDTSTVGSDAHRSAADEVNDGTTSLAPRNLAHAHAVATIRMGTAHVDSPKGVNTLAALALESEFANGANNLPVQYANRRQLVQRLREGSSSSSRTAAGTVIDQRGDRDGWELPLRARLAARGDAQDGILCPPADARVAAGDLHAADDGKSYAAVGAVIRGQGSPPGAAGASAPQGIGDSTDGATEQIRGPTMGLGARRENAALSEHRGGVAKRRPSPAPGGALMTASERIAAIRRRLGARAAVEVEHMAVPATEAAAGGDDELRSKTKEVSKIHYSSWGIEESSCASSSLTYGARDARAHAAADSAWHGRERRDEAGEVTQPRA